MTLPMKQIYACLIELLDACMKELRKSNKVRPAKQLGFGLLFI